METINEERGCAPRTQDLGSSNVRFYRRNRFYFQCALLKLGKIWYTSFDGETLKNVAKPVGVIEEPIVELPKASLVSSTLRRPCSWICVLMNR